MKTPSRPTLGEQNRDYLSIYLAPLPAAVRQRALDELQSSYESRVEPAPPAEGECAPEFCLIDHRGRSFALRDVQSTLVISFYRGGWCAHCAMALRALQRRSAAIETHGGQIVAISPEPSSDAQTTARENGLRFPILHDADNELADRYGLRLSIAPLLAPIYEAEGLAPPAGHEALNVPYPATFVVDAQSKVRAAFVNRDPSVRMEPEDIARVVREIARNEQA
ncbi:MAG: peroxiredoxin family protein [Pseudomonadota bacterium]